MMHHALTLLKDKLNAYFKIKTGITEDHVNFLDSNDPISFPANTITPYLINIAEDRIYRKGDRYREITKEGQSFQVNPEINLNLQVLFVAKFDDYKQSLNFLSYIIKYFQVNRFFDPLSAPELSDTGIEKLLVELITLPLAEQNEVWNSLHVTYLPSVLYKVSLLSYVDDETLWQAGGEEIKQIARVIQRK